MKVQNLIYGTLFLACSMQASLADNRIDQQLPGAPELAGYGEFSVGVKTIEIVNPDQIDVLKIDPAADKPDPLPKYDRPLTVEVWYPAQKDAKGENTLNVFLRDGKTEVEIEGQAVRDAEPEGENH
ncbi:MAG: hypothetical protein AAFW66_05600, partial [Pseudomonadota bacterium]